MSERHDRRRLLRLISGELDAEEARRLRRRAAREPALARELARLERTWNALDGDAEPVPPGFSRRVMAAVRKEGRGRQARPARLSWFAAPAWVRAVGVAALVIGLAAGAFLGAGLGSSVGSGPSSLPAAVPVAPVASVPAVPTTPDTTGGTAVDPADGWDSFYGSETATLAEDYADALTAFTDGEES